MSASANYVRQTIELGRMSEGPDIRSQEAAERKADLERINRLAAEAGLITRKDGVNDASRYRRWLKGNYQVSSAVGMKADERASVIEALEQLIAGQGA